MLRRRSNIAWLTDGADTHIDLSSRLGFGTVVWTPTSKTVYADNIEVPRFRDEEFGGGWEFVERPWTEEEQLGPGRFLSDWPEDHVAGCRYSLTEGEIERVRVLGRLAPQAYAEDREVAFLWERLGRLRGERQDYAGALAAYRAALRLDPAHWTRLKDAGWLETMAGDEARGDAVRPEPREPLEPCLERADAPVEAPDETEPDRVGQVVGDTGKPGHRDHGTPVRDREGGEHPRRGHA